MRHKKINHRQWFHRLIHRKCWYCNVALVRVNDRYGSVCPVCGTFHSEDVLVARERRVREVWWLDPWKAAAE